MSELTLRFVACLVSGNVSLKPLLEMRVTSTLP